MLDLTSPQLQIIPQPNPFHLLQHPPSTSIPPSLLTDSRYDFMSITRTAEEISIVFSLSVDCDGSDAKAITGIDGMGEALKSEGPWRALRVRGPMDLSMTGVMHALTGALLAGEIPIFAISTWNTDYVLIPLRLEARGREVLKEHGWTVVQP